MRHLDDFRDVHPKWDIIEGLGEDETYAVVDLLLTAIFIDDEVTDDEIQVLSEEWQHLSFMEPKLTSAELFERLDQTREQLDRMKDNPDLFDDFVDDIADTISNEDEQIPVFRLLAMVTSADGFDERELDLCYAIGAAFDLEVDTIQDILRAVWESLQEAVDVEAGNEHHIPPIKGKNRARDRSMSPYPNPFTQRTHA